MNTMDKGLSASTAWRWAQAKTSRIDDLTPRDRRLRQMSVYPEGWRETIGLSCHMAQERPRQVSESQTVGIILAGCFVSERGAVGYRRSGFQSERFLMAIGVLRLTRQGRLC